jgi:hypothetical protein
LKLPGEAIATTRIFSGNTPGISRFNVVLSVEFSVNLIVTKAKKHHLDFEVDKLTNSIENIISGESFSTQLIRLAKADLSGVTKKNGWLFNWKTEFRTPDCEVYKLIILNNPSVIHGLVSLTFKTDHVVMNLVENAPFNKGKKKLYAGVAGNLVAFACSLSFQRGHEGNVAFMAKTKLIDHYTKTLGATHVGNRKMIITTESALRLIDRYFKV